MVEQVLGGIEADIATQQQRFQIFEQLVVDLAAGKKRSQPAAELCPRPRQAGLQSLPPRCRRHGGNAVDDQ
jgi:hypothetical protein